MKRREFFKLGGGATLAFMINGLPISAFADTPLLRLLAKQTQVSGRVLVLIQLTGGNDGLNTVIPLDQYSALSSARSNILIPQGKVLGMSGTAATGLHPSMTGIRDLFNDGMMNIVQGVSYPNPNFSHFRATDIWNSGSDSNQYLNTGWLGRYLDNTYTGFPNGYPNASMPDPLAIQIGSGVSPIVQGPSVSMGMAISDINSFYQIVNGTVDPAPATPAGHELTFIRYIAQQTQAYTSVLQNAANNATNLSTMYPTSGRTGLSDQLKIVARLIKGGLQTPVYVVSIGSFDTHATQVVATDTTTGTHADLLSQLSVAVRAFYDDLKLMGVDDRVATMTFSEFGRRIMSNASGGTDHGTSEPVMVFGTEVNPGFIGSNPSIPTSVTVNDNLAMQNDYRSVYAAVLADWFQVDSTVMSNVLLQPFTVLPIFRKTTGVENTVQGSNDLLGQSYPNPLRNSATIQFNSEGGSTQILLFDASGRLLRTLYSGDAQRGTNSFTIDRGSLPAGVYFYRLTNGKESATRQLTVVD
jgi:uncharacterized protein (DUF1501 family)